MQTIDIDTISKSTHHCVTCNKHYTRKSSLEKHQILCDFLYKTKREKQIEEEHNTGLPSHVQLVHIVEELALKYEKIEERLFQMQKWVDKKKKKMNVLLWLSSNMPSSTTFQEWIDVIPSHINANHLAFLFENNIYQTYQTILEHLCKHEKNPICCFIQKSNLFYICEMTEPCLWKKMEFPEWVSMLKKIQKGLFSKLSSWRTENASIIDENDQLLELYNKVIIKLTSISFTQENAISKIRSVLFNHLKMDLKHLIEYEFEF
jgi:hypothetical protein